MSQDKEREAFERRMLDFGWRNFTGDVQGEPPCWYYANADLNARWIGWREARAALASQQAGKGEPVHPNHRPDLRYILTTLERVTPVVKHQKELREQVQASITGMRYVIQRTEAASPPSREPLTDDAILDAFCHTPGIHQFVQAFKAGARFAERAHGIHSRGEGEKA